MQSAVPACLIVLLTASSGCLSTNAYPSVIRHHHQRNLANHAPSLSQDLPDDTYEDDMNSRRAQAFNTENGGELDEEIKARQNQNTDVSRTEINNELDDGYTRNERTNAIEQDKNNEMGYALEPQARTAQQHSSPDQLEGPSDKFNASRREIAEFLSQFYLIRTPYGYILGRNSPHVSTRSLARRSPTPSSQYKPSYVPSPVSSLPPYHRRHW